VLDGAALVAARQLGLKDAGAPPGAKSTTTAVSADAASEATAQAYLAWAADADRDPDLTRDARMMVPVFYDVNRNKMKVWAFLGWKLREVSYRFGSKPEARVFDAAGKQVDLNDPKSPELVWHGSWTQICVPVVEEVYVTRLLNRDEFRRHCDAYQSRTAILTNLE